MPKTSTPGSKRFPLASLFILNDLFTDHYRRLRRAREEGRVVAWTTIGVPKNLLYAMDVVPAYPQFHAAFQSSRGKARHILDHLEGKYEIPHDICGEVKSMIGTLLSGERLAFKLPPPDLMIANNGACIAAAKGLQFLNRFMKVPFFFCDYPFVSTDETEGHARQYVNRQLEDIVRSVQERFGVTLDEEKYERSRVNDAKAILVWQEILKLFRHDPAPVDIMDLYLFFMPLFVVDGENEAVLDLLIRLYNDLRALCDGSDERPGTAPSEIRLLWDILPVYQRGEFFKKTFARHGAKVVMSTYLTGLSFYPESMRPRFRYPLDKEQVCEAYGSSGVSGRHDGIFWEQDANRPVGRRKGLVKKIVEDFDIHAVIMHMDRTCRPMSLPQYELMRYIREELETPVLLFDADSMDERYFSQSQIATRLEAFLEGLGERLDFGAPLKVSRR